MAQAATNADDARPHRDDAEDAQDAAETAQEMAEEQRDMAIADAMEEVFVDGKTKSVGGKSVTFEGGMETVITDGDTVVTGKQQDITDMSDEVTGIAAVPADDTTTPPTPAVIAKPIIAPREIILGHVYDSDEDDARVALIHSYIGTKTVNAFYEAAGATTRQDIGGAGIDLDSDPATPNPRVRAASGTFVATDTAITDSGTILATADEDGIALYFYVNPDAPNTPVYMRRTSTETALDGTVTHNYVEVSVVRGVEDFPEATEFGHFHFGVWADLTEPNQAGENELDGRGIGFLTVLDDGEMTAIGDMPTRGDAIYEGYYVANVQAADADGDGRVVLKSESTRASMTADFGEAEVVVTLTDLATFKGGIAGNEFGGTGVSASAHDTDPDTAGVQNTSGIATDGAFTGMFEGAFFGEDAEEAGGVFDFDSEDSEDGAFTGSFGVVQQDEAAID